MASASEDKTIRIWNVESGTLDQVLESHGKGVFSVTIAPNGKQLISSSWDSSIKFWDAETAELIETLEFQGYPTAAFSADNQLAACCLVDDLDQSESIRIWNLENRSSVYDLGVISDDNTVWTLTFAPNKPHLASDSEYDGIKIWDYVAGVCWKTLSCMEWEDEEMRICSLAYSPDGNRPAAGTSGTTIQLWNPNTGALLQVLKSDGSETTSVVFSPDGQKLASSAVEILIWDVTTGTLLHALSAHAARVSALCFSLNNTQLASASFNGTIRIWSMSSLPEVNDTERRSTMSIKFSPDGTLLASRSAGTTLIRLWNTTDGTLTSEIPNANFGGINTYIFSPDSKQLASIVMDESSSDEKSLMDESSSDEESLDVLVQIHDPKSGLKLFTLADKVPGFGGHLKFSPGCSQLAITIKSRQECWVWAMKTTLQQQILTYPPSCKNPSAIAFSPDSQKIAVSFRTGQIQIWDLASCTIVYTLGAPVTEDFHRLAFSPDGMQLLVGSSESKAMRLWNITTGTLSASVEIGRIRDAASLAFSASGDQFAASFYDGSMYVWKLTANSISLQDTFDGGFCFWKGLSFHECEPYLETDKGLIKIGSEAMPSCSATTAISRRRNAIFLKEKWITRDGVNLPWPPPDYRAVDFAYRNDVLAIAHVNGLISFFQFNFDTEN